MKIEKDKIVTKVSDGDEHIYIWNKRPPWRILYDNVELIFQTLEEFKRDYKKLTIFKKYVEKTSDGTLNE